MTPNGGTDPFEHLLPVGVQVRARVLAKVDELVRIRGEEMSFIAGDGWAAVPVESGLHFSAEDVARILTNLHDAAAGYAYLANIEEDRPLEHAVYRIPAHREAFDEFNVAWSLVDVAVIPPSFEWLIVCSSDDFFVIMGPTRAVEQLSGMRVVDAVRHFRTDQADLMRELPALRAAGAAKWESFPSMKRGEAITISLCDPRRAARMRSS